jgi:prolyl 4-hydroxylase
VQAQTITREMQDWVAEQLAAGYTLHEIFQALLDAGWQAAAANQALGLPVPGAAMPQPAQAVPCGQGRCLRRHGRRGRQMGDGA